MLRSYLKIAFRAIQRHPGNTVINVAGLSIGMASFILITLFVQDQLRYDDFHQNADRIFRVNKLVAHAGVDPEDHAITAGPVGPTLEVDFPQVEQTVRILPWFSPMPLAVGETTLKSDEVLFADASLFDVFSFKLLDGDPATALRKPQSIVLSETMAKKLFGATDPVGQTVISLNDHSFTVTGLVEDAPHNSHLRYEAFISWSSTVPGEGMLQFEWMNRWMTNSMYTFVLLREGSDAAAFNAQLPDFLARNYPEGAELYSLYTQSLAEIHLRSSHIRHQRGVDISDESFVYIFGFSALLILLIACINFVNTSTALADDRAREVGVRKALGANRGQLKNQFLGESILTAAIAFLIAVGLVELALPVAGTLIGKQLEIGLLGNLSALAIAIPGVLIIGAFAGFYPAIVLSRFNPVSVLRGSGSGRSGGTGLRKVLVTAQFVVSTILLGGSVVVFQQTEFMQSRDLGLDQEQVVTMPLANTALQDQYDAFKSEILNHPGVVLASASRWVPGDSEQTWTIVPEGRPEDEDWIVQVIQIADFDFAETYGMEMAAGRFFQAEFPTDSAHGVVINEALSKSLGWTSESAVGKRLDMPGDIDEGYVIGVVKDFHLRSLQHAIDPVVFINQPRTSNMSVRIRPADVAGTLAHLKATWESFESRYPFEYSFVDETYAAMYTNEQQLGQMLSIFSSLAVFVACLGLFGLAALMARRRTKEIGIRKSIGASVADILALLTTDLVRLLSVAAIIAIPIAYMLSSRWLEDFAYRIDLSLVPFVAVGLGMIAVGLIAVGYQSIRAAVAQPVESLRYE